MVHKLCNSCPANLYNVYKMSPHESYKRWSIWRQELREQSSYAGVITTLSSPHVADRNFSAVEKLTVIARVSSKAVKLPLKSTYRGEVLICLPLKICRSNNTSMDIGAMRALAMKYRAEKLYLWPAQTVRSCPSWTLK